MSSKQEDQEEISKSSARAESPTTRPELEIDSDNEETLAVTVASDAKAEVEAVPPPKPPRPLSPRAQAEKTLHDAFPSIDSAVIKAVLVASGGRIEPAFNALLGMSDPDAVEPPPPPQPPRPQRLPHTQLEADELYARQLAESYGGGLYGNAYVEGGMPYGQQSQRAVYGQQRSRQHQVAEEDRSFIDDDLPIIKENLKKGFLDTQRTVNGWISNLKKKIDGEDDEDNAAMPYGGSASYSPRRNPRQSGDLNRYDADPQVLGDDFASIQLDDHGSAARRSTRPLANPDLFKPTPSIPEPASDSRKVSFQNEKAGEADLYDSSPRVTAQDSFTSSKQSKWQPLSNVDPNPIGEAENDPFSLGDSEDEKETKDRVGGKEVKIDDAERLKKAAAEAMADNIAEPRKQPEPAETSGTKDAVAEALATKS